MRLTRRRMLATTVPAIGAGAAALHGLSPGPATAQPAPHAEGHGGHAAFRGGPVDHARNGFDPHAILRDFDWGTTRRLASGRVVREWELVALDKEIEVAPGVRFPAWTYNGRVPGPTLRAREGERLRITFVNGSAHPHTIHFHGIHPAEMDGVPGLGDGSIPPGGRTVYEFDAEPFGLHLYHCHTRPLAEHIAKGLYGAFIIDPAEGRPPADELVMVMNGFDTNFDRANEVYAANTIGFAYMDRPIRVAPGRSDPRLPGQRARVRPRQLVPPARQPLPALPDRHVAGAVGADRHGHAVPGPARGPGVALPLPGPLHVPRAPVRVHRARVAGLLRGARLMEARGATDRTALRSGAGRWPRWLLGVLPLLLIAAAVASFAALGAPGLGERRGPPVEALAVERTVLEPGVIELTLRNDGPDAVRVAQVVVNDAFTTFSGAEGPIGRLGSERLRISQPWVEGEAYEIALLTSTGATITHAIDAAVETPTADASFYGLMALLGLYVGIIPVALGMLWLPWVRRIPPEWLRMLMALTVGLLAFLAIDATLEGLELAGEGPRAFGGAALVLLGAGIAYLLLSGVSAWLTDRRSSERAAGAGAERLALLVAAGIGLHNLGEGIAIGAAYAAGALALGAFLIVGFALHNTTEGLAIVAPVASYRPRFARLAGLGLLAGAPAVLGAWIGASAFNASAAAFLLGAGAGAIVQVVVQLAPSLRDERGRTLHPAAVAGLLAGLAVMFGTGLLVSV